MKERIALDLIKDAVRGVSLPKTLQLFEVADQQVYEIWPPASRPSSSDTASSITYVNLDGGDLGPGPRLCAAYLLPGGDLKRFRQAMRVPSLGVYFILDELTTAAEVQKRIDLASKLLLATLAPIELEIAQQRAVLTLDDERAMEEFYKENPGANYMRGKP